MTYSILDRVGNTPVIELKKVSAEINDVSVFAKAEYFNPSGSVRRMDELDSGIDSVFLCKIGLRSIDGIRTLREAGYKGRLLNLKDGLNAWAKDVDQTMPVY